MFGTSWRVGRIAGIELRVDASWLVIVLLIGYSLTLRFDLLYRELSPAQSVALGAATTVLFFGSVLLHELAHALVARRRGLPVEGITLFLFGGATHARLEGGRPVDELVVTAVGPATSFALAACFGVVTVFAGDALPRAVGSGLFGYLSWINFVLAVFNLLPGFPLDGGRIVRAIAWRITGSFARATRVAGRAGQAVGALLIAGGLTLALAGGGFGGLWIGLIGWFLIQAATASQAEVQVRALLQDAEAEDVMTPEIRSVPPDVSVQEAVDRYFMRYDHGAFPVTDDGNTLGLLTLRGVLRVPPEEREQRTVRDAMTPMHDSIEVSPHTPARTVVEKLERPDVKRVLVMRDGRLAGIITANDLAAWLRRRQRVA